jgi:hypothetical protein
MDAANFEYLNALRYKLGPMYGSEDLCVLLYSLVKREKPKVVVEFGTGLGVSTAWIAAAMAENGVGTIYTVDNGSNFDRSREKYALASLDGPLESLAGCTTLSDFLTESLARCGGSKHVKVIGRDIDLSDRGWLDEEMGLPVDECNIDMVFSDFDHSVPAIVSLLAMFLPRLNANASIFIDSASTKMMSYYMLESLMTMLEANKVPLELINAAGSESDRRKIRDVITGSIFKLIHLVERHDRPQNSTAWLKINAPSLLPAGAYKVSLR